MHPSQERARAWGVAALALAVAAAMLFVPLPRAYAGGWRWHLLNFGHVPLFAGLTVALWRACGKVWYRPVVLALGLAGVAELVQPLVGRSGDLPDFLRGAAGVLVAGVGLRVAEGPATWGRWLGHGLIMVGLVAYPIYESGPTLWDAVEGYLDFPVLADLSDPGQLRRWESDQASLRCAADPLRSGAVAGRIEFRPGDRPYPSVTLTHVVRDFTAYRRLRWEFVVEGEPVTLVFSLRGAPNASGRTSHFQYSRTFTVGEHIADMDLFDAALLARPDELDRGEVAWSQLFVVKPARVQVVYLRKVWLE